MSDRVCGHAHLVMSSISDLGVIRKGLIKMRHVPINRYAYYLTPQGFAEKSRLTAQYLAISFDFFRLARSQCSVLFAECETRGWTRIALCGGGELAEIAMLCAESHTVTEPT